MSIATLAQTLGLTAEKIVVTEIEQDEDSGDHVREVRFLDASDVPVLIVRVSNSEAEKIKITAPEQEF